MRKKTKKKKKNKNKNKKNKNKKTKKEKNKSQKMCSSVIQFLELATRWPGGHGYAVSNFIILASEHDGWWPVLSLTASSYHRLRTVSILNIAESARGASLAEISSQISAL